MKKLTPERQSVIEPAIFEAQFAKARLKTAPMGSEPWFQLMKPYHKLHDLITQTLSASMSRVDALIDGTALLSDYYTPEGTPRKATK